MSTKKTYPSNQLLRRKTQLVCHAIHDLTNLGIAVLQVNFKQTTPIIEVENCPGNKKIKSHFTGQGVDKNGDKYHTRSSIFCGCQVRWQEVKNG